MTESEHKQVAGVAAIGARLDERERCLRVVLDYLRKTTPMEGPLRPEVRDLLLGLAGAVDPDSQSV